MIARRDVHRLLGPNPHERNWTIPPHPGKGRTPSDLTESRPPEVGDAVNHIALRRTPAAWPVEPDLSVVHLKDIVKAD
jgi:hypothetical protein